jgi:hypothetical protein
MLHNRKRCMSLEEVEANFEIGAGRYTSPPPYDIIRAGTENRGRKSPRVVTRSEFGTETWFLQSANPCAVWDKGEVYTRLSKLMFQVAAVRWPLLKVVRP